MYSFWVRTLRVVAAETRRTTCIASCALRVVAAETRSWPSRPSPTARRCGDSLSAYPLSRVPGPVCVCVRARDFVLSYPFLSKLPADPSHIPSACSPSLAAPLPCAPLVLPLSHASAPVPVWLSRPPPSRDSLHHHDRGS